MNLNLSTTYLGMKLENPFVVSASPLCGNVEMLRRLEEAGASAAVLPSLFEEQIEHEEMEMYRLYERQTEAFAEAQSFFPDMNDYNTGTNDYLHHIEAAKKAVRIPIIASLNGASPGGWVRYSRLMEDSGADGIELNIYFVAADAQLTSEDVESRYVELVSRVVEAVKIPVAVKIGPYFTSIPNMAKRLAGAGAAGLVLFNRLLEPDIDLGTLEFRPNLVLSSRYELRVPLRWLAILRDQVDLSLAATSGIHNTEDVIKALLCGADVTMMATTLLRHGPDYLLKLHGELQQWLTDHDYESVAQLRGSMSYRNCQDPGALERVNYMKALTSFSDKIWW